MNYNIRCLNCKRFIKKSEVFCDHTCESDFFEKNSVNGPVRFADDYRSCEPNTNTYREPNGPTSSTVLPPTPPNREEFTPTKHSTWFYIFVWTLLAATLGWGLGFLITTILEEVK